MTDGPSPAPAEPARPILLLSTGSRPAANQVDELLRAARGRPVRWLEYRQDANAARWWREVDDREVTAAAQVASEDPTGAATPAPGAATAAVAAASVPRAVDRAARRRELWRRPLRGVVRGAIRVAPDPVKRGVGAMPEAVKSRLRFVAARPTRRLTLGRQLAAEMLGGALSQWRPEVVVALDRSAAAASWYLTTGLPDITAINAVEPAVRFLDLLAARGETTLHWTRLVGSGHEQDVLAALPPLDRARPKVVLVEVDPDGLGELPGPGRDLVVLSTQSDELEPLLHLGRDRVDVRIGGTPQLAGLIQPDVTPEDADPYAGPVAELHADLVVTSRPPTPLWGSAPTVEPDPARVARALAQVPSAATDTREHLLIAPANYAGQSAAWSRAAEEHLDGVVARSLSVSHADAPFTFPADLPVAISEWQRPRVRTRLAVEVVLPSTHVLLEAIRPILAIGNASHHPGPWDFALGRADAGELLASGRRVALVFHGSEIRRPGRHAAEYDWSPFRNKRHQAATARAKAITDRVHALLADFTGPVFVSTPDLLDELPNATWLPIVVERDFYRPAPPVLTRPRPVVVHAPSSPLLKGTAVIDEVLERLDAEGLVEYRRLSEVPSAFVGDFIREADVLADQIVLGNPGVMAAEALAAGRLVVAHVAEKVRARCPLPLPVVEATPPTFEAVMRDISAHPESYQPLAAQGPVFADTVHSGALAAQVLRTFLDT